ncbi:hypothetical protein Ahy_B10g101829 [Arachis hypogaea]|uniref:ATP-dependent DNA helicase n=1 Tax=Arachis hypogaea TaxID=3818 RepID=A0A444X0G2_ARAHY|nr:hypothetical protein Ahy_B10g101829 [Arachis hypogaea]
MFVGISLLVNLLGKCLHFNIHDKRPSVERARRLTYNDFLSQFVGELYYLRMLLNVVKGPRSYEELRSFNGVVYPTFRNVCYMREASHWSSGHYLRNLFATLLWLNSMIQLEVVWQKYDELSELTLIEIELILNSTGKTFVWNIISVALRSKSEIILTLASSGIASLLLLGEEQLIPGL